MLSSLLLVITLLRLVNGFGCCREKRSKYRRDNHYWMRRGQQFRSSGSGYTYLTSSLRQIQTPRVTPPPQPQQQPLSMDDIIKIVDESCTQLECNLNNKHLGDGINSIIFPSNIQILRLSHNDITMINVQFPESLIHLQLNANKLKVSPSNPLDLSYLINLQTLYMNANEITNFHAIHFPSQLKLLSVASNKLTSFDDVGDLSYLQSLTTLILDGNQMSELNGNISKRLPQSLQVIGLANNQIESVRISVPISLKKLDLSDNPLRIIRIHNIDQCVSGFHVDIRQNELESDEKTREKALRSPRLIWRADLERNCQICCEELEKGEIVRTLPCLHQFHCNCIRQWLSEHKTCPECRHNIFDDEHLQS